ncbi:MAG: DMT family transporter, partial [Acidobacteriota bacterium]
LPVEETHPFRGATAKARVVMPRRQATRAGVFAALATVQVLFGLHYIAAKHILTIIPPRAWATLRIVPASLLLLAVVVLTRRKLPRAPRDLAAIAFFSIFGVVINQVCFVEGLSRTATSHSSIINSAIPVATLLIAILMRYERTDLFKLGGIGLSLVGVVILLARSGTALPERFLTGDLLTLTNAMSYSLFLVISKPILARHSSLAVTAEMLLFGAVGITMLGLPELARLDPSAVPLSVWGAGLFVVLFATVGTYALSAWALKRVDSSHVALFIYLQPLIASLLAVVWLHEPLGAEAYPSAAFIFAGLALSTRRRSA